MRVQTTDGAVFEGDTPEALVEAMNAASFAEQRDVKHFMAQTAMRVRQMTGVSVRSTTAAAFVEDLLNQGYLKPLDEPLADGAGTGERA